MEILTLPKLLKKFSNSKHNKETVTDFIQTAQVRLGDKLKPLKEYMKDKDIPREDIKLLFENIQNRNEYLTRFYNLSLSIQPDKFHMNEIEPMKNKEMNNNEKTVYKNIIRNLHFEDILKNTKSGIENNPTFLDMLSDLYLRNIIDYKILTPSARHYIKEGRLGSVFSSYYFRASIMNPYLVYSLNKSVLHGTKIFTPTLGWSSYCYGFLECPDVIEYVGTDVIPSVCEKTKEFSKMLEKQKDSKTSTTIYCKPSEDLFKSKSFLTKYREHFDLVFFSPPYYRLELYEENKKNSENKQSTNKYETYEEWLEKYWEKTIQLCHHVLESNGKLCYILSGYGSDNTKEQYDLLGDMNAITKKYFKLKSIQPMYNKDIYVTQNKDTNDTKKEQIMIFTKK